MARTVLLLGATGLFGGHLARALIAGGYDVVLAARSKTRLAAFARKYGGRVLAFDRDEPGAAQAAFAEIRPVVVIDAAGPFQAYGADPYRFARAALASGAHYLDLADAPGFVEGISTLDDLARARGLVALSGASSTPALSSAAVEALAEGLDRIEAIETAILPGNRTERGLSVIRAILAQAGRVFQLWRGGRWVKARGWSETTAISFSAGGRQLTRRAALHEAPETRLFPRRYGAQTVTFRAGLELGLLHFGLRAASLLVRMRLMRSLAPLSGLAFRVSSWLKRFGSDQGGMKVSVLGPGGGGWEWRDWDLVAPDGVGPRIPTLPAELLVAKLIAGTVASGARPAMGELTLAEIEVALAGFGVLTERHTRTVRPLFQAVLGAEFDCLPPPVSALHLGQGSARFRGRAEIDGAKTWRGRLAAKVAGFPGTSRDIEVRVRIEAEEGREVWRRDFGGHQFRSVLTRKGDRVVERFGPFSFTLGLAADGAALRYPVLSARFLGLPLPRVLTPISETREALDAEGRFSFDVSISLPGAGLIAHYRGWLLPEASAQIGEDRPKAGVDLARD